MKKLLSSEQKAVANKLYREKNKIAISERRKLNYPNIKDKIKEYQEINKDKIKEYKYLNKDSINKQRAESSRIKYANDILYRIKKNTSNLIRKSFKKQNFNKVSKSQTILGCDMVVFKLYIESKFEPWMNWGNYGLYNGELNHGWDIDHIIPISSANNIDELLKLNNYTNFQPLCSKANRDIKKANY